MSNLPGRRRSLIGGEADRLLLLRHQKRRCSSSWLAGTISGGDGTILVFASHLRWNGLLENGLLDELHPMVGPVALGRGVPLFIGPARAELLDVRRFEDSANVQLLYGPTSARD